MYNELRKKDFVKQYTNSISKAKICESIFHTTEKYEEEVKKDICEMSLDELQEIVNRLSSIREHSQYQRLSMVKDYIKWCVANEFPGSNECLENMNSVKTKGLDKIRSQMVTNPLHLQRYLNDVFDAIEEETIDITYRCFFWLAFSGADENEMMDIDSINVDFRSMLIHGKFSSYDIYREAVPAMKKACELTSFLYKHPNYETRRDRVPGDRLLRGIKVNPDLSVFRNAVSKKIKYAYDNKKVTIKLSYYRAFLSGLFYRMYEREKAGYPVDFNGAAAIYMSFREYDLSSGRNTLNAKKRQIAKSYEEDYCRWKLAFSL